MAYFLTFSLLGSYCITIKPKKYIFLFPGVPQQPSFGIAHPHEEKLWYPLPPAGFSQLALSQQVVEHDQVHPQVHICWLPNISQAFSHGQLIKLFSGTHPLAQSVGDSPAVAAVCSPGSLNSTPRPSSLRTFAGRPCICKNGGGRISGTA